jgi:hypothetical protein
MKDLELLQAKELHSHTRSFQQGIDELSARRPDTDWLEYSF